MRRADKEVLTANEHEAALKCCCAACNAWSGSSCVDENGQPRKPHKVRIRVGRWASFKVGES